MHTYKLQFYSATLC